MSLDRFFYPESVAVIGASSDETKIGYEIVKDLKDGGYKGKIIPINKKGGEILGFKAYPSVLDYPDKIDIAILSIPAKFTPDAAEECGKKGIFGIIVVASGFAEVGNVKLEEQLVSVCKKYNVRLLGPNVVGTLNSVIKMNASFAPYLPYPGSIGMISQSGAMIIALDARTLRDKIGMSHLISIGNMGDLEFSEVTDFLNSDKNVSCISLYTEGLKQGRRFIETTKRITKPIIMLKSGVSQHGTVAAASHTGSLAGSHKVYDGALKQAGVVRAYSIDELFDFSLTLSLQPEMKGDHLIVVTNGGGIGVLATDAAEANGIPLNDPADELKQKIGSIIPSFGSLRNPIDMSAMATRKMYADTIRTAMEDESVDAVLAMYCEVADLDPLEAAKGIEDAFTSTKRRVPLVAAFVGGKASDKASDYLIENKIPSFSAPDLGVRAIAALRKHNILKSKICNSPEKPQGMQSDEVKSRISSFILSGKNSLDERDSKEIFSLYGIKVNKTILAKTKEEAEKLSKDLAFPLAAKIESPDVLHKTDVGGVKLNLSSVDEVSKAFDEIVSNVRRNVKDARIDGVVLQEMVQDGIETIIGTVNDPTFGPTVMFGTGGITVQVLKDVSFRVAPLCRSDAYDMINETLAGKLMNEFRGRKALDSEAVADAIVRFSWLAYEHPEIKSIDANPMIVNVDGSIVVDARILL